MESRDELNNLMIELLEGVKETEDGTVLFSTRSKKIIKEIANHNETEPNDITA